MLTDWLQLFAARSRVPPCLAPLLALAIIVISVVELIQGKWGYRGWRLEGVPARIMAGLGILVGFVILIFSIHDLSR